MAKPTDANATHEVSPRRPVRRGGHRSECRTTFVLPWASRRIFLTQRPSCATGSATGPSSRSFWPSAAAMPSGYALYFDSYEPTYAARGLYLADLYVDQAFRRQGIGRAPARSCRCRKPRARACLRVVGAIGEQIPLHMTSMHRWASVRFRWWRTPRRNSASSSNSLSSKHRCSSR